MAGIAPVSPAAAVRAHEPRRGVRSRRFAGVAVRVAAAAGVLAAVSAGLFMLTRPQHADAMVLMVREMKAQGSVRFTLETPHTGMKSGVLSVSGMRMRVDMGDGQTIIADMQSRRTVLLDHTRRTAIAGENNGRDLGVYEMLLSMGDSAPVQHIATEVINGRRVDKLRVPTPGSFDIAPGGLATVWLDAQTRLPVRVMIPTVATDERGREQSSAVLMRDFAFNVIFDPVIFDTQPRGYAVVAPEATTPGVGVELGIKMRAIALAVAMHIQEHGAPPEKLEDIASRLPEGGLRSARKPDEAMGYVYIKPVMPLKYDAVLAYERFAENSEHLWVLLVDGSAHVKTQAELRAMLAADGVGAGADTK